MSGAPVLAVALASQKFQGRDLVPGDEFETTESELADLKVLGFAQRSPRRMKYESRSLDSSLPPGEPVAQETAPAVDAVPSGTAPARRGRDYARRDMQAQK
jgi:hypothetical protein